MRTQTNEVQAIYRNARRQQGTGKIIVEVMTKADHDAMHELTKLDVERIAQAAGAAMLNSACIIGRRDVREQQETGIKQLNEMLQEMKETESKNEAIKCGLIAAGYANGMYCGDLINKSELRDVIQVIDQAYKKAEQRIEAASRPFWSRIIRKRVKA